MRRQVPILEREDLPFSPRRFLPRLVRCVGGVGGVRVGGVGEDGSAGLGRTDAAEVGADEGDDFLVVEAVAASGTKVSSKMASAETC
jgi:hypothetical protein